MALTIHQTPCSLLSTQNYLLKQISIFRLLQLAMSLKEMDHKKARGVDQINTNLIHKTAEVVAEPLSKLINCNIETGMFPNL